MAARSASREEISAHVSHAMPPRTIVNRLLAAGLRSRVTLARLPLTQSHRQAQLLWCREKVDWRVEWRSVVFCDESRFCMRVMDVNVYGVYALQNILKSKSVSRKIKLNIYKTGGLVAQAVRRSPPTARVPSSRLGPSMWVSW